jgi:hypothetical protein
VRRRGTDGPRQVPRGGRRAEQAGGQADTQRRLEPHQQLCQRQAVEAEIAVERAIELHPWRRVRVQLLHQPADGVEHEALSVVDGTIVCRHPATVAPLSLAGQGPKTLRDLRPYTPTGRFQLDEVPRNWKEAP